MTPDQAMLSADRCPVCDRSTKTLIRIQPVAPDEPSSEELGRRAVYAVVGLVLFLPLFTWPLMLAIGALHDLFPAVPAPGYWTTMILLVGYRIVVSPFARWQWKWAHR